MLSKTVSHATHFKAIFRVDFITSTQDDVIKAIEKTLLRVATQAVVFGIQSDLLQLRVDHVPFNWSFTNYQGITTFSYSLQQTGEFTFFQPHSQFLIYIWKLLTWQALTTKDIPYGPHLQSRSNHFHQRWIEWVEVNSKILRSENKTMKQSQ